MAFLDEQGLAHLVPLLLPKDTDSGVKGLDMVRFTSEGMYYNASIDKTVGTVKLFLSKKKK